MLREVVFFSGRWLVLFLIASSCLAMCKVALGQAAPLSARPMVREPAGAAEPGGPDLSSIVEDVGGPDSAPNDPPATDEGRRRGYGPPPPSPLAFDSWWIGPSLVEGSQARMSMSFLSVSGGKRFTYGRTYLSVRPQFQTLFLGGPPPPGPQLPEQVYALTTDFQVEQPLSRKLSLTVGATPGLYTDWENLSSEAVRVPGRIFLSYMKSPKLILIGGVVYTAQPELPIIPAAGLIWIPSEKWRLELIAPRPRLVYRANERLQLYGQFSFDSSTYAIHAAGRDDLLEYRDFRVSMGTEWTTKQKLRLYGEVGAAFARDLDLMFQPDNTIDPGLFLRAGVRF